MLRLFVRRTYFSAIDWLVAIVHVIDFIDTLFLLVSLFCSRLNHGHKFPQIVNRYYICELFLCLFYRQQCINFVINLVRAHLCTATSRIRKDILKRSFAFLWRNLWCGKMNTIVLDVNEVLCRIITKQGEYSWSICRSNRRHINRNLKRIVSIEFHRKAYTLFFIHFSNMSLGMII